MDPIPCSKQSFNVDGVQLDPLGDNYVPFLPEEYWLENSSLNKHSTAFQVIAAECSYPGYPSPGN